MMCHGQNPQGVFTSLVDEAVREFGEHELANILGDLQADVGVPSDPRKSGINFVREDQTETRALALVVVDSVVELTTGVGVNPQPVRHLRRALASAMT
jgi:hypothetical protein